MEKPYLKCSFIKWKENKGIIKLGIHSYFIDETTLLTQDHYA